MVDNTLEANLLEATAVRADKILGEYIVRWKGRLIPLPRAERIYQQFKHKPSKIMKLSDAKHKAIEQSRKGGKVYIDVDEKGICSISKKFNQDSSVFCYKNGSEIALDNYKKISAPETQNLTVMEKKKVSKPAAKKVEAKPTKGKEAAAPKKADKPTASKHGKVVELMAKEIVALLKKGKEVVTPGAGNPFTEAYLAKGDPTSVRKCVVK